MHARNKREEKSQEQSMEIKRGRGMCDFVIVLMCTATTGHDG